jgi:cbb3-type cytochrome oxidase maturation protein
MSVVYIVLPLALIFVVVALFVFIRSVRAGQFDDMDTPGVRVLHDDKPLKRRSPEEAPADDDHEHASPGEKRHES